MGIWLFFVNGKLRPVPFYLGMQAVDSGIETCCNAGNRMTIINDLFDSFYLNLFGMTLTAHGELSLSHLK